MRKISFGALVFTTVIALCAAPASAHAVFVGAPSGVAANSEQPLVMNVPHERDDTTYNVDIVIAMPTGWQPLGCESKATWTCTVGTSGDRQVVHYVKAAGAAPAEDESFRFTVRAAPTVGSFLFPTVQTYNTGEVVRWIDAAGGTAPAPALRTVASGATPDNTAPTTTVDHGPAPTSPATTSVPRTTPSTTGPPASTLPASSTTAAPVTSSTTTSSEVAGAASTTSAPAPSIATSEPTDDDGGSGGLVVAAGIVAVVGAAGGLFVVRRRRNLGDPAS